MPTGLPSLGIETEIFRAATLRGLEAAAASCFGAVGGKGYGASSAALRPRSQTERELGVDFAFWAFHGS